MIPLFSQKHTKEDVLDAEENEIMLLKKNTLERILFFFFGRSKRPKKISALINFLGAHFPT